ncbi:protease pro-enzyme activation domain-containing protein [Streptacidiphilus sp. EB103A]|uniref:S53 family peptidase n=1 Tax=Streptacidiphilus sp. EB103A TaxID=3156275 RepID=UPI0035165E82
MKTPLKSLVGLLAAPLPIIAIGASPATAQTTPALTQQVAVHGDVVPAAGHSTRLGAVASDKRISVAVSLAPRDRAGLNAFLAQVHDPKSPQYKHYLTVKQFAARFGASAASIAATTAYLSSQGLSVGKVYGGHLVIDATGSAAQVEKAFHVALSTFRDSRTKRDFYANTTDPTLPRGLAANIVDVSGLNNYAQLKHFEQRKTAAAHQRSHAKSHAVSGLTPTQALAAYDLSSENSNGYTGSGQTIGLVEFSSFDQSNIDTYDSTFSLSPSTPSVVSIDGGTTDTSGEGEVELDIEVIQALAPGASIKVYEAPNSTAGDTDLYAALVSADVPIVSISWGQSESSTTSSSRSSDENAFSEASAQGQSVFAASGDNGSDDAGDGTTSVDFPASDQYVTGVGGTTLSTDSSGNYSGETAWSGSGGGTSALYAQPSYQSGVTSDTNRDVPDVSAVADPSTGWAIYTSGAWAEYGGTSAAAPNWAAFTAIYDQYAAAKGGSALGYANSSIYALATGSNYSTAFHDVTSGSNGSFSAGTGYDQVTGWGSYDGANFITASLG